MANQAPYFGMGGLMPLEKRQMGKTLRISIGGRNFVRGLKGDLAQIGTGEST